MNDKLLTLRKFLYRYRYLIIILFVPVYWIWFVALEHKNTSDYTAIHCFIDDVIPFCEYFIIPYYLWFGYVVISLLVLFIRKDCQSSFLKTAAMLISGMILSLVIYTLFPNGQDLRPDAFPRENIFTDMVAFLYRGDTCTNVCPSLHVYNSIVVHAGLSGSPLGKKHKLLKVCSLVLCVLICLSTLFLKQHSAVDVFAAMLMYALIRILFAKVLKI